MPFTNPVMAGKFLVRQVMQSLNFLTGVSGWQVTKAGGAEFNSITIRGTTILSGSGGVFVYNGTPAHGNPPVFYVIAPGSPNVDPFGNTLGGPILGVQGSVVSGALTIDSNGNLNLFSPSGKLVMQFSPDLSTMLVYNSSGAAAGTLTCSIAVTAGTDGHGNAYKTGVTVYGTSGSSIELLPGTSADVLLSTGDVAQVNQGSIFSEIVGSGGARTLDTVVSSPDFGGDSTQVLLQSASQDGTTQGAYVAIGTGTSGYSLFIGARPAGQGGFLDWSDDAGAWGITRSIGSVVPYTLPNTTTDTQLSDAWTLDKFPKAGTTYEVEVPFTGVHEGQVLNFGCMLNSTFHNVVPVGGAFMASGDTTVGTIRLYLRVLTTGVSGTAMVWTEGTITDASINRGSIAQCSASLDGLLASLALNTTVNNTLALAGFYTATAAGQTTVCHGATFTRKGT